MPTSNLIKIVVSGHTNSGKTTVIRSLMKRTVGIVSDRANVTKETEDLIYDYEGLQAIFTDTPGFQNANILLLENKRGNLNNLIEIEDEELELKYDIRAFEAIKKSDVVLYVASSEQVPDNSHRMEIALVKAGNNRVIGLVNKGITRRESIGIEATANRIDQWKKLLNSKEVSNVIEFDAHWHNPETVSQIYEMIKEVLPNERKIVFEEGLNKFQEYQVQVNNKACTLISDCILKCRETKEVLKSDFHFDEEKAKKGLAELLLDNTSVAMKECIEKISEMYRIEAGVENVDILYKEERATNVGEVLGYAGGIGFIGGLGGGVAGGVIGSLVGLLSGGLGIPAGAWLGTQIGTAIGSMLGGFVGGIGIKGNRVQGYLENNQLKSIANQCIITAWIVSHHGYGLRPIVKEDMLKGLQKVIIQNLEKDEFDWKNADQDQTIKKCLELIMKLDKEITLEKLGKYLVG